MRKICLSFAILTKENLFCNLHIFLSWSHENSYLFLIIIISHIIIMLYRLCLLVIIKYNLLILLRIHLLTSISDRHKIG